MKDEMTQLSKKIANRYMQDGLLDIYLGLIALAFGLDILLDFTYLVSLMVVVGLAVQRFGKNKVTYPRIGFVKLKKEKKRAITSLFSGVFLVGIMVFFLFTLGMDNAVTDFLQDNMVTIIAVIWSGATALAGLSFNVPRFFAYAVVLFLAVFLSDWIGGLGVNLVAAGTLIILAGMVVMLRFIRKYPIHSQQD